MRAHSCRFRIENAQQPFALEIDSAEEGETRRAMFARTNEKPNPAARKSCDRAIGSRGSSRLCVKTPRSSAGETALFPVLRGLRENGCIPERAPARGNAIIAREPPPRV